MPATSAQHWGVGGGPGSSWGGSPRQHTLGAVPHAAQGPCLAWDGWLSWRGTCCLVQWALWAGPRHSPHCLGWLRLRSPVLGCQGAGHGPGKVPTAAWRHATAHAQTVAHVYIACTPVHTSMHQYRHTGCARPHKHTQTQNMHCCPAPVTGTCTLARTHTRALQQSFPGAHAWAEGLCEPHQRHPRLGHPDQLGTTNPTGVQGHPDPGCFVGGHGVLDPAAHRGGWLEGGGTETGATTPACSCLHLPSPETCLAPWWEHDGCTWEAGGLALLTTLGIAPTGL